MFLGKISLNLTVWPLKTSILDRNFRFYAKNPPYSWLESSQVQYFGPYMTKFMFKYVFFKQIRSPG